MLARACGVTHPAMVTSDQIEILDARCGARTLTSLLGGRGLPDVGDEVAAGQLLTSVRAARAGGSH